MSQRVDLEKCSEVLDHLEAWIDGDLDPSEAAGVEAHVDVCASCGAARREAEELIAELRSLPEFDVPERVVQSVRGDAVPTFWARLGEALQGLSLRPAPVLAVISTVVLAVAVVSIWRGPTAPQYTEQEIARAAEETTLALAYVGSAARRAELSLRERILEDGVAAQTVRGVGHSLKIIGGAASVSVDQPATPLHHSKGS